jgi:hypothetical protein
MRCATRSRVSAASTTHCRGGRHRSSSISRCTLSAVPARLRQFANLENLILEDLAPDVRPLLSFPKLTHLRIGGIRALQRDDVAGCPRLAFLGLEHRRLEELDLDIIDVCPNLHRVFLAGTPLSEDKTKMDALHAGWRSVSEITPRP